MPSSPAIGALAHAAMAELAVILETATSREPLERWITSHAYRARLRDRQVVYALAVVIGDALLARRGPRPVWKPAVGADPDAVELMRGRLVAAYLNDDPRTVEALSAAWATWPEEARAALLRELVRVLPRH